jgi:hypothetical protein
MRILPKKAKKIWKNAEHIFPGALLSMHVKLGGGVEMQKFTIEKRNQEYFHTMKQLSLSYQRKIFASIAVNIQMSTLVICDHVCREGVVIRGPSKKLRKIADFF